MGLPYEDSKRVTHVAVHQYTPPAVAADEMLVLAVSDIHIGSGVGPMVTLERTYPNVPGVFPEIRHSMSTADALMALNAFKAHVEQMERKPDLILIPGDIFDTSRSMSSQLLAWLTTYLMALASLTTGAVKDDGLPVGVVAILGNHDVAPTIPPILAHHALTMNGRMSVRVVANISDLALTYKGTPFHIVTMPWPIRKLVQQDARLDARERLEKGADTLRKVTGETIRKMGERLGEQGVFRLLLAHAMVDVPVGREEIYAALDIESEEIFVSTPMSNAYDMVVSGHLHKRIARPIFIPEKGASKGADAGATSRPTPYWVCVGAMTPHSFSDLPKRADYAPRYFGWAEMMVRPMQGAVPRVRFVDAMWRMYYNLRFVAEDATSADIVQSVNEVVTSLRSNAKHPLLKTLWGRTEDGKPCKPIVRVNIYARDHSARSKFGPAIETLAKSLSDAVDVQARFHYDASEDDDYARLQEHERGQSPMVVLRQRITARLDNERAREVIDEATATAVSDLVGVLFDKVGVS